MLELLIGQIPEAIYFALFLVFAKRLKEKRLLFTFLMVLEYVLLKQFLHYTLWFQVLYVFLMYVILKILYKEKAQITDVFTFMIGSFTLLIISGLSYAIVWVPTRQLILAAIVSRVLAILFLMIFRNKLYKIQNLYKKFWNRNDKVKKRMKSTTFRCVNLILFNLMFIISNIVMFLIICGKGGA